jgi:2-polyprenyl-3-methyl-5-hydroxy-6-metoxy-1,4-benzoquinol methylase
LYRAGYERPPLSTYLLDFYAAWGQRAVQQLTGDEFILDECAGCGLVFQRMIPDDALMQVLYGEWIDTDSIRKAKVRGPEYFPGLARQIEAILAFFQKPSQDIALLDFGMGWGEWCRMAMAYGCAVYGAELSEARIAHAGTFGVPVLTWEEIAERRFDFINSEQVFEHLARPRETLEFLAAALKPGGVIRISVPNGIDIKRRLRVADWKARKGTRNSLNPVAPLEHLNCFTNGAIRTMAGQFNLTEVAIRPSSIGSPLHRLRGFAGRAHQAVRTGRPNGSSTDLCFRIEPRRAEGSAR